MSDIYDKIKSRIKPTKAIIMTMPFGEGVIYQKWKESHRNKGVSARPAESKERQMVRLKLITKDKKIMKNLKVKKWLQLCEKEMNKPEFIKKINEKTANDAFNFMVFGTDHPEICPTPKQFLVSDKKFAKIIRPFTVKESRQER